METSEATTDIFGALAKAQGEMTGAVKDSANPFFKSKYADLASVWDACRKPLTKNGLAIVQSPSAEGSRVSVDTLLTHTSGQWIRGSASCTAKDDSPQSIGSAITYLRRYALQSFAGVAPEEDDGEAAQGRGNGRRPAEAPLPLAPEGYDAFLARLGVAVAKGTDDLLATWKTSDDACRKHLTLVARKEWEAMKTAAAAVTSANKTVAA